jgi:2'-5' RNA ligase
MRLFIALDIDDAIRQRIERFIEGVTGFAPEARWARPEALHVTLKFIGEQPETAVEKIKQALSNLQASATEINPGYGFSPRQNPRACSDWRGGRSSTRSPGGDNRQRDAAVRNRKEDRVFSPHLTLASVRAVPVRRAATQQTLPIAISTAPAKNASLTRAGIW